MTTEFPAGFLWAPRRPCAKLKGLSTREAEDDDLALNGCDVVQARLIVPRSDGLVRSPARPGSSTVRPFVRDENAAINAC